MKKLCKTIYGVVLFMGLGSQVVAADTPAINWRMQALWDAGTTPYKYEEKFVEKVAKLTEGKFKIKLFSAGQIVPPAQAFTAVKSGAFQLMKTYDGYEAGKIPTFAFTGSVPFGFEEPEQYEKWFYEKGGLQMVREAYAPAGLFYIAPTIYGAEPIHSTFPINTLSDLKDKKGRFVGLASTVMADLGVITTPIPTAEVYQGLEKKVIDFADRGDLTANYEAGLGEVTKYIVYPGFHQPTTATSYVANQRAYDKLPEQYKEALAAAAMEVSHELRDFIRSQNTVAIEKFKKQGVTISSLDKAEIKVGRNGAMAVWEKVAGDDPLAKKVLKSQIDYLKAIGLIE